MVEFNMYAISHDPEDPKVVNMRYIDLDSNESFPKGCIDLANVEIVPAGGDE